MPGVSVRVTQKFTPADGVENKSGLSFVRIKKSKTNAGGWVPIMKSNGVVGVVPARG